MEWQLIGSSPAFKDVLDAIETIAPLDNPVLVMGETGTGKELVARAIHDAGPRRSQAFVAVNCAAIPAGLLESELFGYERGAFTGATGRGIGRFEAAHGGTLFLDEIGDLSLELQPKLLRVLQEQQVERLGAGGRAIPLDVRVIAASNHDLWDMVQKRSFRADLYYRLNVFPIVVPALRQRVDDIPELVRFFVARIAARHRKPTPRVPDEVLHALMHRPWPGNVRELQNIIEHAVISTKGPILTLGPRADGQSPRADAPYRTLAQVERDHILQTLRAANWVIGGWDGAATRLGLSRTTLIARMQRLGLTRQATSHRRPVAGRHDETPDAGRPSVHWKYGH